MFGWVMFGWMIFGWIQMLRKLFFQTLDALLVRTMSGRSRKFDDFCNVLKRHFSPNVHHDDFTFR